MWQFLRSIIHSNFGHWFLGLFTGYTLGTAAVLSRWAKEYHRERRWIEHLSEKYGQEQMLIEARTEALTKKNPPVN